MWGYYIVLWDYKWVLIDHTVFKIGILKPVVQMYLGNDCVAFLAYMQSSSIYRYSWCNILFIYNDCIFIAGDKLLCHFFMIPL